MRKKPVVTLWMRPSGFIRKPEDRRLRPVNLGGDGQENIKNKKTGTQWLTVLTTGAIVQLEQRKRNKRNEENRSKVPEGVPNPELF